MLLQVNIQNELCNNGLFMLASSVSRNADRKPETRRNETQQQWTHDLIICLVFENALTGRYVFSMKLCWPFKVMITI